MLLLFDIDGTLVAGATDAHRDALYAALLEVHRIDPSAVRRTLSPAGRTDGEIARSLLLSAGVSAERIDARADRVREHCCQEYTRLCTEDLSHTVLVGIPELLAWVHSLDHVTLGLVTGNYECVARLKLAHAGLGRFFPARIGGFGSDSEDRTMLPAIARRRAGTVGRPYPRQDTIVIGDTPRDIACAHADEVRCFAVATGPFGAEELAGAEVVVRDANELREAIALMALGS